MSETSKIATVLTDAGIRNAVSIKGSKGLTKGFLNDSRIPALTAYEYRGYIISAWARPEFTNGSIGSRASYSKPKNRPSNTE